MLKGAPFEKLVGKTYDGIKIDPVYSRARGAAPIAGRAAAAPWQIMQRIDHPDPAQANAQALHDLENGATGLTLVFAGANGAHGFGLDPSAEAVEKILPDLNPHPARFARRPLPEGEGIFSLQFIRKGADEIQGAQEC